MTAAAAVDLKPFIGITR